MESRVVFWGLGEREIFAFYVIGFAAMGIFVWGFARHILKYMRGRPLVTPTELARRLTKGVRDVFTHRTLRRRDKGAGWAHTGIFYGFLGGFIITSLYFLELDILEPLFGVKIMTGKFYLVVSLAVDLGHLALTCGLIYMIARRALFHLAKLDYRRQYRGETELRPAAKAWRIEDWIFLLVLLTLELQGFTQEAVGLIVDQPSFAAWSIVGFGVSKLFLAAGMTPETAAAIRAANWWLHGVLALAFTAAIPWYKAKHIIAAAGSLLVRDMRPLSRLPPEPVGAAKAGVSTIGDLTWKDMLHLDACTKCGRCHEVCPARTAGYPLSPRDFILDLRLHNDAVQGCDSKAPIDLVNGVINAETLWACRSCGACQDICPVGIEHPSLIVRMRRSLVEKGIMDPLLRNTLGVIGDTGNSFGASSRQRSGWTNALDFKVKDIRQEAAPTLWFVGDYASFDPRNQKVSQTVARLFKAAGEDFALLHEGEKTAGNDVRRVGEEGLWEELAHHNLSQMGAAKPFQRIITTDPHSYNTIKNEYPSLGEVAPITHYSNLLADLLRSGRLKVKKPLNKRVTFHDPCHLGRLNGGYDAPREVLALIGAELVEMPRNRDNSFCCGAGGGRIWIPDTPGTEKPSENRVHEAASLGGIDVFVTCCPKDLVMFEDARKTGGHEKDFVVQDLAELVAEAIELNAINLKDLPPLADRIVKAVAVQIADVVAARIDQVIAARLAQLPAVAPVAAALASAAPGEPQAAPTPPPMLERTEAQAGVAEATTPVAEPASAPAASGAPLVELKPVSWAALAPVQPAVFAGYEAPPKDGPRILVSVKHVAKLGDEFSFTPDGHDIPKAFMEFSLNEWDDAALEEALLCIERIGSGEVVVVTVGDEDAEATLRKALAKGAHRAVRVWDEALAGADPITIARALAGIAKAEAPDLIFSGVQSSDQAHGATGTALARILGLPHAAVIVGLEWDGQNELVLARELEGGMRHAFKLAAPAVAAIQTGINTPRFATMKMIKTAREKPLVVVDGAGVVDGSAGYAVRRMYVPEQTKAQMLTGTPQELAKFIADLIRDKKGA